MRVLHQARVAVAVIVLSMDVQILVPSTITPRLQWMMDHALTVQKAVVASPRVALGIMDGPMALTIQLVRAFTGSRVWDQHPLALESVKVPSEAALIDFVLRLNFSFNYDDRPVWASYARIIHFKGFT